MSGHTPGTWIVVRPDDDDDVITVCSFDGDPKNRIMSDVIVELYSIADEADARLIAAAPDGLDANREALDFIQSHFGPAGSDDPEAWSDPDAREVADKLRSAIAKATGATET